MATPFPWKKSEREDAIIGELPGRDQSEQDFYGGRLVCESLRDGDRDLVLRMAGSWDALLDACVMVLRDVGDGGPASDHVSAYTAGVVREALVKAGAVVPEHAKP